MDAAKIQSGFIPIPNDENIDQLEQLTDCDEAIEKLIDLYRNPSFIRLYRLFSRQSPYPKKELDAVVDVIDNEELLSQLVRFYSESIAASTRQKIFVSELEKRKATLTKKPNV